MTVRERLCAWLRIEEQAGPNAPKVNDEEILNVLRREKEKEDGDDSLSTNQIADELPIVQKTVTGRLTELEGERVTKRNVGSTYIWSLAEGEPETVVNPEMGVVIEQSSKLRRNADDVQKLGRKVAGAGFFFLFIGMSLWLSEVTVPAARNILLAFGYSAGLSWRSCLRILGTPPSCGARGSEIGGTLSDRLISF